MKCRSCRSELKQNFLVLGSTPVSNGYISVEDLNKAESWYLKSIAFPFEERLTKDIRGLAYLGLTRIAYREKKPHLFRKYLRISEDFIEYKNSLIEHKRLSHGK